MTHRASTSRGFTLLELILALTLSLLLIGGALGLFTMVLTEDRVNSARFDSTAKMGVAHAVIERAMQTLVAGKPEADAPATKLNPDGTPVVEDDIPGEDEENEEENDPNADPALNADGTPKQPGVDQFGVGSGGEGAGIVDESADPNAQPNPLMALLGLRPDSDADHFELFFEQAEDGSEVPRLELVLSASPAPKSLVKSVQWGVQPDPRDQAEPPLVGEDILEKLRPWVRGAFELVRMEDGWALQWRTMEPPEEPFVLVRGLASCTWRILPRRDKDNPETNEWQPLWNAYIVEDFPIAVELTMTTLKGVRVDWVFETMVRPNER